VTLRRLAPALLVLGSVAVALVLAEAGLRLATGVRSSPRSHMTADPVHHHRLRPNWSRTVLGAPFETNSLALRGPEITMPKPAGVFRVFMLGDSFTEGAGFTLESTAPKFLETFLNERKCGRRFEVINAGVASYSPILEYLQLTRVGLGLDPDLVLLNFDMTDVHDDWVRTAIATLDARGLPVSVPPDRRRETAVILPPLRLPPALRFLAPLELLLHRSLLYQNFRTSGLGEKLFGPVKLSYDRLVALGLIGDVQYDILAVTRDGDFPRHRAAWALTERYIVGIREAARARGASFVLALYPHGHQISEVESPEGRLKLGVGPGLYPSERPFQILEALGRREGFPVINLLAFFRDRERTDWPLYRRDDFHHDFSGVFVLAEGLRDGLLARRLVPCRATVGAQSARMGP
jgi:hypothetical protein